MQAIHENGLTFSMRAAGKPGYVAKIVEKEKQFLCPKERTGYSTSREKLTFELSENGIYEVCSGNFGSSRRDIYFIKVENGEEVNRADSLSELVASEELLPELEGSTKQVNWGENIRQKFISKLKLANKPIPDWVQTQSSAKWWIDHRKKI